MAVRYERQFRGLLLAGAVPLLLALAACGGGKSKPAGASVPEPPAASDVEVHLPAVPVG